MDRCLAQGPARDPHLLVGTLYEFTTTTSSRVPMTDWYETATDNQHGFQAARWSAGSSPCGPSEVRARRRGGLTLGRVVPGDL